jgi:succinyl-diaminopimelate desuccinylase
VVSALTCLKQLQEEGIAANIYALFTSDEETGGADGAGYAAELMEKGPSELPRPDYVLNLDGGFRIINRRRAAFGVDVRGTPKKSSVAGVKSRHEFHTVIQGQQSLHAAYFQPGSDSHALITLSKLVNQNRNLVISRIENSTFIKGNILPERVEVEIIDLERAGKKEENLASARGGSDFQSELIDETLNTFVRRIRTAVRLCLPTDYPSEFGISITPNIMETTKHVTRINFDVRAMTRDMNEIQKAFQEVFPGATIEVRWGGGYVWTPVDHVLVKEALSIATSHGLPAEAHEQEGATDSRYFSSMGIPCIDVGPVGENIHGNNEFVSVASISSVASFLAHLCRRLASYS